MGLHAFTSEPEHCQRYRDLDAEVPLPQLVGYSERWNIPVAHHKRGLTESRFDGVNHYVLTYHIGGASVTKANWPRPNPASTGALSLEMPGHGGRYTSTGIVEYAHLYFRPSLVSEVADEVGVVPAEGPGDAFALSDDIAARDAQEYLRRASDPLDPAGAIEMDSRG
ncbi:MAG: AraC family transcriptional regulator, partial [Pseudomonadota bacterium]